MQTIIFGKRSILTKSIQKIEKKTIILSNEELKKKNYLKKFSNHKNYNLIINSFYPSHMLGNLESYKEFYKHSLLNLSELLDEIKNLRIKKIIYSSSSSVYNSLNSSINAENDLNRKIYATSKIAAENLISNFCYKKKISFINARLFNMYGDNDNFSIISKIIYSYQKKKKLKIYNYGNSVRDFIHADDVAKIYLKLLKNKKKYFTTFDIGTGKGVKIIDLLNLIKSKDFSYNFVKKEIDEAENVLADISKLKKELNNIRFKKVENYIKSKLKIDSSRKLNFQEYSPKKNLIQDVIQDPIVIGSGTDALHFYNNQIKEKKNVFCFVDNKNNNKNILGKKLISKKVFFKLAKDKVIMSIVVAKKNINYRNKLLIWNEFSKYTKNISFYNKENKVNYIENPAKINFSNIFSRVEKKEEKYSILRNLKSKNILVTGGGGSIGSEVCRQLTKYYPKKIIAFDNSEYSLYNLKKDSLKKTKLILGDINELEYLEKVIKENKIQYIFHSAAYKHVNFLEENIVQAVKNNIFGTLNLINLSKKYNFKLTIISTDKAAKPKSILGYTKRISEILAQEKNKFNNHISIVRFGNVFASRGSAIPNFIEQIVNEKKITITDENVKRYFMSINEAADLVIKSIAIKKKNKNIFLLKMGRPIKIINILKKLAVFLGKSNFVTKSNIKFIGLSKGEKLIENLAFSKNLHKTKFEDIVMVNEPCYEKKEIDKLINDLFKNKLIPKNLIKIMRVFLRKEI